jgi:hypothetical protein
MRRRNPIAFPELVHIASHSLDNPRHFIALVYFNARDEVIGSFPIAWVAGAVYDFNEDFIWPWLRDGNVDDLAPKRMRFDYDGFHDRRKREAEGFLTKLE